jgi:transcriptional regulator with XRE-family HTH domain
MTKSGNPHKTDFTADAKGERALPQSRVTRLPISSQDVVNMELANLGKTIRMLRENRHLSQTALGEEAALHRTYICDVERGARNVTFLSLIKLANGLGTTVSEITQHACSQMPRSSEGQKASDSAPQAAPTRTIAKAKPTL